MSCIHTNPPGSRAAAEDDIREAVFRHQFADNEFARMPATKAYFLSVMTAPPRSSSDDAESAGWLLRMARRLFGFGSVKHVTLFWDEDPSSDFLARFAGHEPTVKPVSASAVLSMDEGIIDKETRQPGVKFWVGQIQWQSPSETEVEGGYYKHGLAARGNTYRVVLREGKWVVVDETMAWIA